MTDHTRYVKYQLDLFFKNADENIEELLNTKDFVHHSAFLNHYIRNFPTLGDCIYRYIYISSELCEHYADYTLEKALDGGIPEVEKKRREFLQKKDSPFYIYHYHKYILKKVKQMEVAGDSPELKSFLDHWQEKLEKQGFMFQHRAKESATVRNVAFHLAFALGMNAKNLKDILVKCLLQQVFNPKDHLECIFWYCLDKGIPYTVMRREYLDYYRSEAFDTQFQHAMEKGIADTPTMVLEADIHQMMDSGKEDFFRYLWRLKYTESLIEEGRTTDFGRVPDARALKWKTPHDIYWENICHFVDVENGDEEAEPLTETQYAARFPKVWQSLRRSCHEKNTDPMMDRETLKMIFSGVDYSKRGIENRKWGLVDMSRTEIIATQFIACCARGPAQNMPRSILRRDFLEEVNEDLVNSGLRKFYLRSPFELFVILCFLHEDPFCYFMASWEEALQ